MDIQDMTCWLPSYNPLPGEFSLAVIPDSQELAAQYHPLMESIVDWIVANREKEQICFVADMGDVTWNGHMKNDLAHNEYTFSSQVRDSLLAVGLEYSLSYGNHDFTPNGEERDTELLNHYFGKIRTFSSFRGSMDLQKVDNTYFEFEVQSKRFLLLSLECCPRPETIQWANQVVEEHPRHNVIVATHAYLNASGERYPFGQELWDQLVSRHANIFLVLCGHDENFANPGSMAKRQDLGMHGNRVIQVMANAQDIDVAWGGVGLLLMIRFREQGHVLDFNYFSPPHQAWAFKECNQFSVDLPQGLLS